MNVRLAVRTILGLISLRDSLRSINETALLSPLPWSRRWLPDAPGLRRMREAISGGWVGRGKDVSPWSAIAQPTAPGRPQGAARIRLWGITLTSQTQNRVPRGRCELGRERGIGEHWQLRRRRTAR